MDTSEPHPRSASRTYRKKITIDHTKVSNQDLADFSVLIALHDTALKATAYGGHVAHARGEDLFFVASDGQTRLDYEVETYDPATGALRAWVKIPVLSHTTDTILYLCYGPKEEGIAQSAQAAWDGHYRLVLHLGGTEPNRFFSSTIEEEQREHTTIPHTDRLYITDALTVEAWIHSNQARSDALQTVVSKWSLRSTMDAFETYDAGNTDGLNTRGFFGAVFDGRYVYFVPQYNGEERHAQVLRYDTHGDFQDRGSWSAYDAGNTSGLNTKGYYGAVFDGRYVYFVPRFDGVHHHSRLLRYDTRGEFKHAESWCAFDAGNPVSYQNAAFDGRYIYFAPGYETGKGIHESREKPSALVDIRGPSGKVLRYDTQGALTDPGSYTTYDAGNTSGLSAKCYDGAVFDGRYVYFSPLESIGIVLRYDTEGDFTHPESWKAQDVNRTSEPKTGPCVGAIFDGRYVYFVPYANRVVARYDTHGTFEDGASWITYDAGHTSLLKTKGYDGAAFDGRYVYFIPFWEGDDPTCGFHARVLRYDTEGDFTHPTAWAATDGGRTVPPNPGGFNGGAFDGRYVYFSPWREDAEGGIAPHGKVLRYDTAGPEASFMLKYADCGHNGGLGGALPGPTFSVNTATGVLNVRANMPLEPGWHHIAGVYDGSQLTLFIDGVPVNQAEGTGSIQVGQEDVAIGCISGGGGEFRGTISEVRISDLVRSAAWIWTTYQNLKTPIEFIRVGEEERAPFPENNGRT